MDKQKISSCDIFCTVVDNYGDIGVCWRLARQLSDEQDMTVRLWLDDLPACTSCARRSIRPKLCSSITEWKSDHWGVLLLTFVPAQLVIEAFACELPERYVLAMAAQTHKPVWLNLEYLSAEDWVAGCHGLPSPHPRLPLIKYFSFPALPRDRRLAAGERSAGAARCILC